MRVHASSEQRSVFSPVPRPYCCLGGHLARVLNGIFDASSQRIAEFVCVSLTKHAPQFSTFCPLASLVIVRVVTVFAVESTLQADHV